MTNPEKTIKTTGVPSMSVGKVVASLGTAYSILIKNNMPIDTMPSVMLWGPPGVGKSQGVSQIAESIQKTTGKKTVITDVRLMLFNPIDLRGIPTANEDKTLAVWLKPKIFQMDPSDDVINILFLDEISAAPQSVQAAAYQIVLDRVIGEHKLPDNCIVIAAGNRVTDKSVAYKMPKALANRLMHIDVSVSFDSWRDWAINAGINEKVIAFLSFKRDCLMKFDTATDDLAFPTPRTWEMVSNILNEIDNSISNVYPFIAGLIGTGMASEFRSWESVYSELPSIEDIFDGKQVIMPKDTDVLYALISSMAAYAKEHKDDMDKIANSIRFALNMAPDFTAVLFKDYLYLDEDYKKKLMNIPEFMSWIKKKGRLANAIN